MAYSKKVKTASLFGDMLQTHAAFENLYFQITIRDILIGSCVV